MISSVVPLDVALIKSISPEYVTIDRPEVLERAGFESIEEWLFSRRGMPHSTVTETIGPTSKDRADVATWVTNLTADLTDHQTGTMDEVYSDSSAPNINVSNSGAGGPWNITLTVTDGFRIQDGAGWPSCGTASGQGAELVWSSGAALNIGTNDVIIDHLEIRGNGAGHGAVLNDADTCVIRYCVFNRHTADTRYHIYGLTSTSTPVTIYNCQAISMDRSFGFMSVSGNAWTFINCTVWDDAGSTTSYQLMRGGSGSLRCNNCIVLSTSGSKPAYSGAVSSDNNMSHDTSAPGTTTYEEVTPSDILEVLTAGSEDLTLKSAKDGDYEGSSGWGFTDDISGVSRTDYDLGSTEIIAAAGGVGRLLEGLIDGGMLVGGRLER